MKEATSYFTRLIAPACAWCGCEVNKYIQSRTGRALCIECKDRLADARRAAWLDPDLYAQRSHPVTYLALAERDS
jgi:hypothetical protein